MNMFGFLVLGSWIFYDSHCCSMIIALALNTFLRVPLKNCNYLTY